MFALLISSCCDKSGTNKLLSPCYNVDDGYRLETCYKLFEQTRLIQDRCSGSGVRGALRYIFGVGALLTVAIV